MTGRPMASGQAAHPVHFLDRCHDVLSGHARRCQLEDPRTQLAQGGADPEQLVLGRVGPGDRLAVDGAVGDGAGGGEPSAPAAIASLTMARMAAMSSGPAGSLRAPRSPITYARTAPWAIWVPTSTVKRRRSRASRYSGKLSHSHVDAFGQGGAGDVLDPFHQPDEPVVAVRARRGEADAAVAGDDGRHPVPRAGGEDLVPRGLPVVVGVDVDPARRDQGAVGVDGPAGRHPVEHAHGGDAAAVDGHVSGARGCSRAVHDGAAANDEIVHRATSLSGLHGGIGPLATTSVGITSGSEPRRW